jgi:hypothetical protein
MTNNADKAASHANAAEKLLEESAKHKMQPARAHLAAMQAGAHATLAVYYSR